MQIILLQRIVNLGKLGETVDVKPGYGRNFLIPLGKALPATKLTLKSSKHVVLSLKLKKQKK